jgi:exodeoxyribonuclease VII large subunit
MKPSSTGSGMSEQFSIFQPKNVITVSQMTSYLRQVLESDEILQDLWVTGEISNFARPASGHLYFSLKDSEASIRCVMWRSSAARMNFSPRDGLAVQAHGSLSIYEVSGQVQLYVDTLKPAGEGALYQEYLRLKAKLDAEGLFDEARKQPIPKLPRIIGIVTSPTGAALQDMLNTLRRRYPIAEVVLAGTAVQGIDAPPGIAAALQRLNSEVHPDVILIGRGGGSIEDLWAFNEEVVVRAVVNSTVPVISGVGHETDFTLTDFAADLRAPTPTAAAELATPDKTELLSTIHDLAATHATILQERLLNLRWEVGQTERALSRLSPAHQIDSYRQRLDELTMRQSRAIKNLLDKKVLHLKNLQQAQKSLNPHAVLSRGYAIVTRPEDGALIRDVSQVAPKDTVHIRVGRGEMDAMVTQIDPGE